MDEPLSNLDAKLRVSMRSEIIKLHQRLKTTFIYVTHDQIEADDEAKQKAAFEFIKFMVTPEQQVYWNEQTGYFPVTTKAYDLQEMKDHLTKTPQFKTAIDQLHASSTESRGALLGVFPEARQTIEVNIESALQGKSTPEEAVEASEKSINTAIEKYNKANK